MPAACARLFLVSCLLSAMAAQLIVQLAARLRLIFFASPWASLLLLLSLLLLSLSDSKPCFRFVPARHGVKSQGQTRSNKASGLFCVFVCRLAFAAEQAQQTVGPAGWQNVGCGQKQADGCHALFAFLLCSKIAVARWPLVRVRRTKPSNRTKRGHCGVPLRSALVGNAHTRPVSTRLPCVNRSAEGEPPPKGLQRPSSRARKYGWPEMRFRRQ